MVVLLFFGLLALAVVVANQRQRLQELERRLDLFDLRADRRERQAPLPVEPVTGPARVTAPPAMPQPVAATVLRAPVPPREPPPVEELPPRESRPARKIDFSFEDLAGGKLPIWVGGIALVFAAIFLVRYSIEQGLLRPPIRTALAGLFGLVLLAASEAARRVERFAEDPRVGQALAGAGIASLYATLYMAGELYFLIPPATTIALMAVVTAAALFLSLRHGPPTATMGLVGGFAAPFFAEPSGSLVPLLVYLGLLIAGLFAVAIQRGWLWLALAATGGGIAWSMGIIAADLAGIGPSLGVFIAALAVAAAMLMPRTGAGGDARVRILPVVAGFVQLAIFVPRIDFGHAGWALYGLLSAAALYLGRRERALLPASFAGLGLVLILLFAAFLQGKAFAMWAAIGATLLFAVPGHLFARRPGTDNAWTILALGGSVGPLMAACAGAGLTLLDRNGWGALFAFGAVALAWLSWRARGEARRAWPADWALAGGALIAAVMASSAALLLATSLWSFAAVLAVAVALSAWARRVDDATLLWAGLGHAGLAILGLWLPALAMEPALVRSIAGDAPAPPIETLLALLAAPFGLLALAAWLHRERASEQPVAWASLAALAMTMLALLPFDWQPAGLALLFAAALLTTTPLRLPRFAPEALFGLTLLFMVAPAAAFASITGWSLAGSTVHYPQLPAIGEVVRMLVVPAAIIAASAWLARATLRQPLADAIKAVAALAGLALFYTLAKQPLAIADAARFVSHGFVERAAITQAIFAAATLLLWRGPAWLRHAALCIFAVALFRLVWFDALILNPLAVRQAVGSTPFVNAATLHFGLAAAWLWLAGRWLEDGRLVRGAHLGSLLLMLATAGIAVRQLFHGSFLDAPRIFTEENYAYSAVLLALALVWLWRGIVGGRRWLRMAGLLAMTAASVKAFLIDAAALDGLLRVMSFLALGLALIGIGWAYGRVLRHKPAQPD